MGFKEFMDQNGKFITESEAQARLEGMKQMRERLLQRLEMEKQHKLEQEQVLAQAHEQDVRDANVHTTTANKQRQHNKKQRQHKNKKQSDNANPSDVYLVDAAGGGSQSSS
jgi:superfamily I DNA and RNA helicase